MKRNDKIYPNVSLNGPSQMLQELITLQSNDGLATLPSLDKLPYPLGRWYDRSPHFCIKMTVNNAPTVSIRAENNILEKRNKN